MSSGEEQVLPKNRSRVVGCGKTTEASHGSVSWSEVIAVQAVFNLICYLVYNTVPGNTAVFSDTGIPPITTYDSAVMMQSTRLSAGSVNTTFNHHETPHSACTVLAVFTTRYCTRRTAVTSLPRNR